MKMTLSFAALMLLAALVVIAGVAAQAEALILNSQVAGGDRPG